MPMNKNEFISAVAGKAGITQADAGRAVDAVLATVTETLARGEDIHPGVFLLQTERLSGEVVGQGREIDPVTGVRNFPMFFAAGIGQDQNAVTRSGIAQIEADKLIGKSRI